MFYWTCLNPSEVMELQKYQQELNLDVMRLHIMKSVWPPPLVVMKQKRTRTQQGVGRAARRRKKCVNVAFGAKCREKPRPWSPRRCVLTFAVLVLHQQLFLYSSYYLRKWVNLQTLWYPCSDVKMSLHILEKKKPCPATKNVAVLTAEQCLSWGASQDNLIASCPSISLLVLVLLILKIL